MDKLANLIVEVKIVQIDSSRKKLKFTLNVVKLQYTCTYVFFLGASTTQPSSSENVWLPSVSVSYAVKFYDNRCQQLLYPES
jgi:hypothetical protein